MARTKQLKFEHNAQADNVIQEGKEIFDNISGNWNELVFKNDNPIVVEIGCGHGDYTLGLARLFPDKNFLGIDVKGTRINKGAKIAENEVLTNVAFLRLRMHELLKCFVAGEVDEFWITFPDPRPKDRDERRRLVYPRYLNLYRDISNKGTIVNLKTDNHGFYEYGVEVCGRESLEILAKTDDLYKSDFLEHCYDIQTAYEKKYLEEGIKINYLKFKL